MATSYITSGLPHYTNSSAAINNWEPIFVNQFEVIFTPPAIIQGVDLLLEQVMNVKGLPEITPSGVVEQNYKFATRSYSDGGPEKTTADVEIQFEVNITNDNHMYTYNTLRQWANIHYNPANGSQGLKRDYVGAMTVNISNKKQEVFRVYNCKSCIMFDKLTPLEPDYMKKQDIYRVTAKFRWDNWDDKRAGAYDNSDLL